MVVSASHLHLMLLSMMKSSQLQAAQCMSGDVN
jgi:hypothetical protein